MNKNIKFNIEQPSNEDLFTGNGHLASALAIKNTLEQQSEIKIIGLEGELGAGKSSIIKILESKLDKHYKFIYFDISTYYHNSFKSEFIKFFSNSLLESFEGSVNKRGVESATNKALGKTFVYNKETQSRINWLVFIFAISIIFSVRYLNDAINIFSDTLKAIVGPGSYTPSFKSTITCLLGLSPLIALLINWLNNIARKKKNKKLNLIGDLLKRNSSDTITETLLINKEVGGFELKEAFEDMLKEIPSDCTVVLILDNIDRIEKDKLGEIWSDIDIFSTANAENFKIILPFSERHVSQALNKDDPNEGKEYISKKLPVVFKAPPVVTASWRDLFDMLWRDSLPEYEGIEESKNLISIWKSSDVQITPRFIKKHINDVASVVACNSSIKNAAFCSAYILACRYNNVAVTELLSNNIGDEEKYKKEILSTHKLLDKLESKDKWFTELSCIHYQTSPDIARSELLDDPIRIAISTNNPKTVIELSNLYGYDIVLKSISDDVSYLDFTKLCATAIDEKIEGYTDWIKKWIPVFNSSPEARKPITNNDKNFIESIISLKNNNYSPNTDSIRSYKETLEKSDIDIIHNNLYIFYLCYTALKDECEIPNLVLVPDSKTVLLLWEERDIFIDWKIRDIDINRKTFITALEAFRSNEELDFSFMRWGMKCFDIDNTAPYLQIKLPAEIITPFNGILDADRLMCLAYTKEWYDSNFISTIYPLYKRHALAKVKGSLIDNRPVLDDILAAHILVQTLHFALYDSNINYIDESTSIATTISVQEVIEEITSSLSNDSYSDYIFELLNFITDFSRLHDALTSVNKSIYIEPIRKLIVSQRYNALSIEDIIQREYKTYRDILTTIEEIKEFISYLYRWEHLFNNLSIGLWSPEFIADSLEHNQEEWGTLFEKEFTSISSSTEFWVDNLTQDAQYITIYLSWLIENKKHLQNQDYIVGAIKTLHSDITELKDIEVKSGKTIDYIFSLLDLKNIKLVTRHFQNKIMQLGTSELEKYAIIILFGSWFKLKATRDHSIQELYISLIESTKDERVLNWFSEQDFKLNQWSNENIVELEAVLSGEPYKSHFHKLKPKIKNETNLEHSQMKYSELENQP